MDFMAQSRLQRRLEEARHPPVGKQVIPDFTRVSSRTGAGCWWRPASENLKNASGCLCAVWHAIVPAKLPPARAKLATCLPFFATDDMPPARATSTHFLMALVGPP